MLSRATLAGLVTLFATLIAAPGLLRLEFDTSNASFFVQGDPTLADYEAFLQRFGSDEVVYVLVETPGVFQPDTLADLLALGTRLRELEQVLEVRSPLHARVVFEDDDGALVGRSLAEDAPRTPAALRAWERRLRDYAPFQGLLLEAEARRAGYLVRLDPEAASPRGRAAVTDALDALLTEPRFAAYPSAAVGTPLNATRFARLLTREMARALGWGLALAALCLWLLFRAWRPVLAPALVVVASLVITLGAMGWCGIPLSMVSTILLTLLICVGVADAMHVTAEVQRQLREGLPTPAAIQVALRETWRPCLWTSLTTGLGFLALLTSEIAPVRHLGGAAALGSLAAFVATLGLVPFCLRGWGRAGPPAGPPLRGLQRLVVRRPGAVCVVSLAVLGGASLGLPRLQAEHDFLAYLDPAEPLRRELEFVQQRMGGAVAVEVVVDSGQPDGVADAELLARLAALGEAARELDPLVRSVRGVADELQQVHHVLGGPRALPSDDAAVAELLLTWQLADPEAYARRVSLDGAQARLTVRLDVAGSRRYQPVLDALERDARARFAGLAQVRLTGGAVLLARMKDHLLATQARSFALALVVIAPLLLALAGSWRLGLLSLIPNVTPILAVLGVMGWLGIAVEVSNALLATVAIGIVVDDTVHMIHRYRRCRGVGDVGTALGQTLASSGRAVLFTSLVLIATFAVYAGSSLSNVRAFGLLAAATFAAALLADVVLLPALIAGSERWRARR